MATPDSAPNASSSGIEDIVVTARRSVENAQRVPVTVQAFSSNSLREASISTPQDLQMQTPGVYLAGSGSPSNTVYTIRGQSRTLVGIGQAAVVTYMSDVPLPTFASGQPQYDLSSLQVLKGPQGTLFGRNTTGGAILLYPEMPRYMIGGYAQLSYGNYDALNAEGALNVPVVTDKVALRVAGRYGDRDGFVKNLGVGKDFHDLHSYSGRVSLLIEPTPDIRNLTTLDYYKQREAGPAQVFAGFIPGSLLEGLAPFTNPTLTSVLAQQKALGIRKVVSPIEPRDDVVAKGISNRTDIELGSGITFTNIFGYREVNFRNNNNFDGLPYIDLGFGVAGPIIKSYRADSYKQFTDEVQLKGKALNDELTWLVGAFYLSSKPAAENIIRIDAFGATGAPIATFTDEKSKAVFANVGYRLVEGVTLNLGARYTWDKIDVCNGVSPGATPPYPARSADCRDGSIANATVTRAKFKKPTWTLGVDWQVNDDLFAYVTSRRGYRAGGVNAPVLGAGLASFQKFNPETITDVELGAKGNWRAGDVRGRFSVAAFYSKSKDVQYNVNGLVTNTGACTPATNFDGDCDPANDPAGTSLTFNAGDTSIRGIEAALTVVPLPRLTLDIAGSYLKYKTDRAEFGDLTPFLVAGGDSADSIPFRFSPKQTLSSGARYEIPLEGESAIVANVDYYMSGRTNYGAYVAPRYELLNLRLDWNSVAGRPVDLSLFVRNALDEKYTSTVGLSAFSPGTVSIVYGDPPTYGVQVRVRFGA